jgi:hypothetical protein
MFKFNFGKVFFGKALSPEQKQELIHPRMSSVDSCPSTSLAQTTVAGVRLIYRDMHLGKRIIHEEVLSVYPSVATGDTVTLPTITRALTGTTVSYTVYRVSMVDHKVVAKVVGERVLFQYTVIVNLHSIGLEDA